MSMETVPTFSDNQDAALGVRRITTDPEHLGIRLGVPLLAVVALFVVMLGLPPLLATVGVDATQMSILAFPAAVVAAVVAAYGGDRLIKRFWPSRRVLLWDAQQIALQNKGEIEAVLRWDERINVMTWHFAVPRRGRVPKGHLCLGMQLVQDDAMMTLYTFLPPKRTEEVEGFEAFNALMSRKVVEKGGLSMRVVGEQRRLREAEKDRWESGAEMEVDDFLVLWAEVQRVGAVPQS